MGMGTELGHPKMGTGDTGTGLVPMGQAGCHEAEWSVGTGVPYRGLSDGPNPELAIADAVLCLALELDVDLVAVDGGQAPAVALGTRMLPGVHTQVMGRHVVTPPPTPSITHPLPTWATSKVLQRVTIA